MLTAEITPKKTRHDFSRIRASIPLPKLIEVQHRSYDRFLQKDLQPQDREEIGLQAVFRSIFPIKDFRDNCELDFSSIRWAGGPAVAVNSRASSTLGTDPSATTAEIASTSRWSTTSSSASSAARHLPYH